MAEFIIRQGEDGGISWPIYDSTTKLPMNFVGWTGEAQIRSLVTDKLLYRFTTAENTLILNNGAVTLVWKGSVTASWNWSQAKYGVELVTPDLKPVRIDQGIVTLSKENVK